MTSDNDTEAETQTVTPTPAPTPASTSTPAPPAPRRRLIRLQFVLAFVLGVALVAGVGGGALYAYGQQYTGRILPGVHVGDVDLSGLAPSAGREALTSAYASLGAGHVLVPGPDGDLTIGYAEIGRQIDVDALIASAIDAGRRGEPVADLIGVPQAALRGITLQPVVTYDRTKLAAAVATAARVIDQAPVDASVTLQSDGTFAVAPGTDGHVVDQAALIAAIAQQITSVDAPAEITVRPSIVSAAPAVSTAAADAARTIADRMTADLVLTRGTDSWTIPGAELRKLVTFSPTSDGGLTPVLDEAGIDPLLADVADAVNQAPKSATFKLSGAKVVVGADAREGRALDVTATRALILDALMARQTGNPEPALQPVVAVTEPSLTTAAAEAVAPKMVEISRWKTYFPVYIGNGYGANIWIPAGLINGYVLGPGEMFDFWKAIGPVTRAKGYKDGGVIIDGKTEPQGALAGGICSCSTTLFNAALRAGLKMDARLNHYYYISRYPLGLDATVFISSSGATQTMSFTNDTPYPVLIRGINTHIGGSGYVTFVIYSVPNGRTVNISPATVKNVKRATDTVEYTSSLPKGTSKRVEYPTDGKDVWRTVTVSQDGKVLRSTTYYSHYSVITGVLQVGTGGGGAPKPTPRPSAPPATPTPAPTAAPAPSASSAP